MRKTILGKLPGFTKQDDADSKTRDFKFELITPMFGGDSRSWDLNVSAPVRTQSVKGQLRFWWRTMQAEQDHSKLLQSENALWGGKSGLDKSNKARRIKSPVRIAVVDQTGIQIHKAMLNDKGFAVKDEVIPTYVAFPVTPAIKNDNKDVRYVKQLRFTLRVTYPKSRENEVLNTLKLWTLFGGVGARTRRGCGSLFCEELLKDFTGDKAIKAFIMSCSAQGPTGSHGRLDEATLATRDAGNDAANAWFNLIKQYAAFRQDRRPNFGRSYWPEPDSIRELTGQNSQAHQPEHPDRKWFPRAAFGLPIITKFNTKKPSGRGDPEPQVQLQPNPDIGSGDRWPSPVILKVIKLCDGRVLAAGLLLNQSHPEELVLKQGGSMITVPPSALPMSTSDKQRVMRTNKPLPPGKTIYQALFKELNLSEVK